MNDAQRRPRVHISTELSWADVFVGYAGERTVARSRSSIRIPGAVNTSIGKGARSRSFLPDTVFIAAWLVLERQWRGSTEPMVLERTSAPSGPLCRRLSVALKAGETSAELLQRTNALRRDAATGPAELPGSSAPCQILWGPAAVSASDALAEGHIVSLVSDGELVIEHPADMLCDGLASRLLACLLHTASQLLERPEAAIDELETLDPEQRQRIGALNEPLPPIDSRRTVHGMFSRQAIARGQSVALRWLGGSMTYAELERESTRMAQRLACNGAAPGSLVAVALDRSPAAVVVLLGVLKCGAAYLPMDKAFPAERLAFMLRDAGADLLVTTAASQGVFPAGFRTLLVDGADPVTAAEASIATSVDDGALAYVMYTSGSTGEPKGIEISHGAILRLVIDARFMSLTARETMLAAAPLGFDASTLEIWGPLLSGGSCALHEEVPTGRALARTIEELRVSSAWLTSALFNAVVDEDPLILKGLQQLLIGGEALSVPHVRRAQSALPGLTLINGYGPTECTTFSTTFKIPHDLAEHVQRIPIGRPINDTSAHIVGPNLDPLPMGAVGELVIGGRGLAKGYRHRPELSAERFVADPFAAGQRLYRTGDRARFLEGGVIDFLGRVDGQVKIRGYRIEPGEIEAAIASLDGITTSAVIAEKTPAGHARLVAYVVAADGDHRPAIVEVRAQLAARLPDFMVPAAFVWLDALPITDNGKLDRRALPAPSTARPDLARPFAEAVGDDERRICEAFARALGIDAVGRNDNFFDLGGNSLLVLRVLADLGRNGRQLSSTAFFRDPTPAALTRAVEGGHEPARLDPRRLAHRRPAEARSGEEPIAVIGMAGRFPGARSVEQFWDNLCAGRDGITVFSDAELDPALSPELLTDPCYVKARGVIDDVDRFDAAFFGISAREAELMDPQQRIFLELCWECLERAGHAPDGSTGPVGVFAGMYNASYFRHHVMHRPDLIEKIGEFQVMLANEKDYIATRVANRLNLTGPAVSVHTACSTSLVAIVQAFTSLRAGQCDMALAGGASITCPPNSGYLFQDGAMLSPDGRTRSFDADAQGTVFSDGAAVVLLKRLSDALADGDTVHAVIRGGAVNNDGRDKASFTAPSVDGQAAVIAAAHAAAGIDPRSVSYVETHGTATPLGDPVEIEALTQAFRQGTADIGFCRVGSLKSNVGHTVIAAGAAGVIKTALALAEQKLPPSIHYERPNPKIDFATSPFVVCDRLTEWPRGAEVRRAGVSSFGVGGTNAHVVMEEAPLQAPSSAAVGPQLLLLGARSAAALERMAAQLADAFEAAPGLNLADAAHTLQVGRSRFTHRLAVVAATPAEGAGALRRPGDPGRVGRTVAARVPPLVWLFTGQGAQYAGMGSGLRAHDVDFREAFDECLEAVAPAMNFDLRAALLDPAADALSATAATQPATFCIQVALARMWLARGARPAALIGHSVGEFAAAVVAGVMSLRDAARLVALRGALVQALPAGAMLSVRLPAASVVARLPGGLCLASENSPSSCVVAGPSAAIAAWQAQLDGEGVVARVLQTSHAFHSSMMDPAVAPFEAEVRKVSLAAPRVEIVSTLTGAAMTPEEATDPRYWSRHLREPVRFSAAVTTALARHEPAFLELGPRGTLATLARQHVPSGKPAPVAIASLADTPGTESSQSLLAQGSLWALGIDLPAPAASPAFGRRRVMLPTYPFERTRHWIEAAPASAVAPGPALPVASVPTAASPVASPPASPVEVTTKAVMSTPTTSAAPPAASRRPRLVQRLREVFEDVSGADLGGADPTAAFVELGLDSLTLTQAALQVKKQFGVPLTFRLLMEKYRSLDSLAEFLDASVPPEAAAPEAALASAQMNSPVAAAPMAVTASGSPSLLQEVIAQQMQLMARQLALLEGSPLSSAAAAAAVAPTPVAAAPVVAPVGEAAADAANAPVRYDAKKAFGAIARIHTQASEVTGRQKVRLETFMRRYVERTAKSKAYTVRHRPRLADPRVVNGFRPMTKEITYQIVVERSLGSRLWDIDGHEYVDVLNGFGMNLFGWQPPFVQEAVRRQLDAGYEIGPQHPLAGEVADLVCELTGFDRAGLCNTGSEAVMAAVRIARTVTGRNTLVLFTGSYHGTFDEVLVRAGRGGKGIPAAPGILSGVFGDVRVLDYGTPEALEFIRSHADDIAAVLVEPVQSRRPDFQPREFLQEVRAITEKSGSCLIFDEVITGFRAHLGGTQALFGIRADLACYGKVIGGGFPIGVVAGTGAYMDALDGGSWDYGDDSMPTVGVTYFAGTFVRHPLALAAARASLEHLKQQGPALQERLTATTAAMADELSAFCREVGAPLEIRHFASLWRVSWHEDHPLQDLLFAMMRSRGVHILDNFPCFMTTAHTPQDVAVIKSAFKESVAELQESDFLPRRMPVTTAVDASRPPVPNARLGRDKDGKPAWFVPDARTPGKFVKVDA